ncbi:MAG: hypothetical protein HYS89_02175 [Candidatus Colwellbacteria bacterium]|nr:hypothetical protein [Candidatus Colwellbacteria bacterium]
MTAVDGSGVNGTGSLPFLVDAQLAVEQVRIRTQVRKSHLALNGRDDPETDRVLEQLLGVEEYVDGRVAEIIRFHPAYPWFSKVKGVGNENIGKIVGLVRVAPETAIVENEDGEGVEVELPYAKTISALWKFCGYHVVDGRAPKKKPGEKLDFNAQARTMCWRLSTAITKAGIRQFCTECDRQRPPKKEGKDPVCECGSTSFESRGTSKFAELYLREKTRLYQVYANRGVAVVPASQLPKDERGKRYEPANMISEGHVHNQALRKMTKIFLGCLWLVWREAMDLPTRSPYAIEQLGHTTLISPWDMVDR